MKKRKREKRWSLQRSKIIQTMEREGQREKERRHFGMGEKRKIHEETFKN